MKFFARIKKVATTFVAAVTLGAVGAFSISSAYFNHQVSAASTSSSSSNLTGTSDSSLKLNVKAAVAIDATTGQVLYYKNATQALPVASMSKLLTVYLVLQAIKAGKLSWDQKITVDSASQKVSQNTSLSNVPLKSGYKYTIKQLYQATLIYSANGAAMALGYAVAGSHTKFIDMMRAEAKKMGITDASIYTANGLANGEVGSAKYPGASSSAQNKFSAKDMAIISYRLLNDYPEVLKTTSITKMYFNNGTNKTLMENWNWMLKGLTASYSELHVDGLKTGTSDAAGACFAATVTHNGHRIITVVLGAKHSSDSDLSRFTQTQKLMSYVYNNYTYTTLKANKTYKSASSISVPDGASTSVGVAQGETTHIWLKSGVASSAITATLSKKKVNAPVKANQSVGNLQLKVNGQNLLFLDGSTTLNTKAVATSTVQKANIFVRMWRSITSIF